MIGKAKRKAWRIKNTPLKYHFNCMSKVEAQLADINFDLLVKLWEEVEPVYR